MRELFRKVFCKKLEVNPQIIRKGRIVGNTTRLVDSFVQEFFEKGQTPVYDHYKGNKARNKRILNIFLRRLDREHKVTIDDIEILPRPFGLMHKSKLCHSGYRVILKR